MKKLISTLAILACAVFGANAQRVLDLQVTLKSPAAGTTITSGMQTPIVFTIKNLGPQKVDKTKDTMVIEWYVDNNYVTGSQSMFKLNNDLNAGDSITLPDTLNLNFSSAANGAHDFCVAAVALNRSADSTKDANFTNNLGCRSYQFFSSSNPTGINEVTANRGAKNRAQTVSFYPNPVTNVATAEIYLNERQSVSIIVSDITGKVVYTEEKGAVNSGMQKISANLNSLNNGLYLVKIVAGNQQYMGKVVLAK